MKIFYSLFLLFLPLISLGYFYEYFRNWAVNGSLYPLIWLCILLAISQIFFARSGRPAMVLRSRFLSAFTIFLAVTTITTFIMSIYVEWDFNYSAYETFKQPMANAVKIIPRDVILFLCFYAVFAMNRSFSQVQYTLKLVVVSFFVVVCYGYVQILSIIGVDFFKNLYAAIWPVIDAGWAGSAREAPYIYGLPPRVNSTMPEASEVAHYFQVAAYPFLLASIVSQRTMFKRRYFNCSIEAIVFVLSLPVLLFTFSSAGYVALFAQVLLASILYVKYNGISGKALLALAVGGASVVLGAAGLLMSGAVSGLDNVEIIGKLFGVENGSSNTRYALTLAGFRVFLHFPLFGVGPANTNFYMERFLPDWANQNYEVLNAIQIQAVPILNYWVDLLASFGLVGGALYFYLMYITFRPFAALSAASRYNVFLKTAAFLYLCSTVLHGFNSSSSSFIYLWAIWAVYICLVSVVEDQPTLKSGVG